MTKARRIDLIGHRGARGLFPENTLSGFAATLAIGVDGLELDVAVTADDVAVVTHDARLNPDITRRDGVWLAAPGPAIRALRAVDIAICDVGRMRPGSDYAAQFPDQVPDDGAGIPRLDEVMHLDGQVVFTIELKSFPRKPELTVAGEAMADAVMAVVDAVGVVDRVVVQSFDWRGPRRLRHLRPDIRLAWLTRSAILPEARVWWDGPHPSDFGGSVPRAVAAEGGPTWAPEYRDLTEAALAEAHGLGLRVVPWTVNRPSDMRRLIGWGIDGLITDRPDLARRVMAEEGVELPPSPGAQEIGRG